ncbi:T9SS type A sorting domain-containing protein [Psychroserpens sp.]
MKKKDVIMKMENLVVMDVKINNTMNIIKNISTIVILLLAINVQSQTSPFSIEIEPIDIPDLGGVQSFAYAQNDGKWLVIGGRLDGLHRRQPFAAFDVAGNNNQLIVIDPINQQKWSAPITSLPVGIQEQISSTNMEFYQEGDYLYFIGGYGYSDTAADHITYSNLTAIKVSDVINAVVSQTSFTSFFRQISDPLFAVTGGRLKKINTNYYLLGGQKFTGRYNPQGPNNGPGFEQEYTNEIRVFTLIDDGVTITVNHIQQYTDTANLHRRDYNAEQQILPNGQEGVTMFSGVFQESVNLPFLNSVNIDQNGYTVNNNFQQYYNHYHCAVLPIYEAANNKMHTVFFGGIAQYYDNEGVLVQDDNVPFVKTIARVTRDENGTMFEYKLPIEMPTLLGAGSEFIPNLSVPHYNNKVFKLDDITNGDAVLVGYIYGGISSTSQNIFFTNDGTQSSASSQIFRVLLSKSNPLSIDDLNENSINSINMKVFPNPNSGNINIKYTLVNSSDVKIKLFDIQGRLIIESVFINRPIGDNTAFIAVDNLTHEGIYLIQLETQHNKFIQKLIIKN